MCVVHGLAIRKIPLDAAQQTQQQQQHFFFLFHPSEFHASFMHQLDEPTAPAPDLEGILAAPPHIAGWCSALYSWLQSNETASIRFAQHWWTPYVVHRPYTVVFFFVPCLVFPSLYPTKLSVFVQGERSRTQHPVNIITPAKLFTRREVNVWHFSLLIFFFFWCIYFSSSPDRFVFRCYSRDKWL